MYTATYTNGDDILLQTYGIYVGCMCIFAETTNLLLGESESMAVSMGKAAHWHMQFAYMYTGVSCTYKSTMYKSIMLHSLACHVIIIPYFGRHDCRHLMHYIPTWKTFVKANDYYIWPERRLLLISFSRKLIWLQASPTNRDPKVIGHYYLSAVKECRGMYCICIKLLCIEKGI